MDAALQAFRARLYDEWLPAFCKERGLPVCGFDDTSIKLSAFDANNFIRAVGSAAGRDRGGGRYLCPRSTAFEQLFWEGERSVHPRRLTLWLEPVITIATIGRLHLDFGWTPEHLCMQPKTWAFDFAVYEPSDASTEYIVGEVKKNRRELDRMIELMQGYGRVGVVEEPAGGAKRNAWRKWRALRDRRAPLFWAVGPDDYTRLFAMHYPDAHVGIFNEISRDQLARALAPAVA
jgi:hypothetical protein